MTPEKASQSMKLARDRLTRETSKLHERYRKTMYRVQSQCEHDWRECNGVYEVSREWHCAACGVVSKKNPIRPTRQEGKA